MILDTLEEATNLTQLFHLGSGGIQVRIGTENTMEAINQCSLITATFAFNGQSLGTIGILGPTRMEYGKVMSLLDYLSHDIALLLTRKQS